MRYIKIDLIHTPEHYVVSHSWRTCANVIAQRPILFQYVPWEFSIMLVTKVIINIVQFDCEL